VLPERAKRGRKPKDLREILNAIRCMVRPGGGWRVLPVHSEPCGTVYSWFRCLAWRLLFQAIHDVAPLLDRELASREASGQQF